ncbi:uncharacterized protein Tco025E_09938, partial [Trypanosoma conorhini]
SWPPRHEAVAGSLSAQRLQRHLKKQAGPWRGAWVAATCSAAAAALHVTVLCAAPRWDSCEYDVLAPRNAQAPPPLRANPRRGWAHSPPPPPRSGGKRPQARRRTPALGNWVGGGKTHAGRTVERQEAGEGGTRWQSERRPSRSERETKKRAQRPALSTRNFSSPRYFGIML